MSASDVADVLRERIEAGDFRPGHALPSKSSVRAELGVADVTVQAAINLLAAEGFVIARSGAGVFVRQPPATVPFTSITEGFDDLSEPERVVPPLAIAREFGVRGGDEVHRRHQVLDGRLFTQWSTTARPKANPVSRVLESRAAAVDERQLLGVRPGTPVAALVTRHADSKGRIVRVDRVTVIGAAYRLDLEACSGHTGGGHP